jgi:hypothetical protein
MRSIAIFQDVCKTEGSIMTILTQFVYLTTRPVSHEDAKEDPSGTKLRKAGYLQE